MKKDDDTILEVLHGLIEAAVRESETWHKCESMGRSFSLPHHIPTLLELPARY